MSKEYRDQEATIRRHLEADANTHHEAELKSALLYALDEISELRAALEELVDHHCGGFCGEGEEARGYVSHSTVMDRVNDALGYTDHG